jgi:hypothetical protein
MSRSRTASLGAPPELAEDLGDFPRRSIAPSQPLYRVAQRDRKPWWFGNSLAGRFDLPPPQGTCYLAFDALAALLEVIGPDRLGGVLSTSFFAVRRLWELRLPREHDVADLTARRAARFGITAEIGGIVPYDLPQAWALRLHQAGVEGLLYWLRHDPSRTEGLALFGDQGEAGFPGVERPIGREWQARLEEEFGFTILDIPRAEELRMVDQ